MVAAVASAPLAHAGGPFIYADNGSIVKWPTTGGFTSVTLTLDQGNLGLLANAQADGLVADVIGVWNGVSQSTVRLTIAAAPLTTDVTHLNYQSFVGLVAPLHGFNPLVYDVDGQIMDLLAGNGGNQFLGYASPVYYVDANNNPAPGNIVEGRVVLNGRFLDGNTIAPNPEVPTAEFEGVIVHELGHMLGLDHSQINPMDPTNNTQPTMVPFFVPGTSGMRTLKMDDIAWISYLYPSAQYAASFGSISGQVIERVGPTDQGFQGINVIARRVGGARIDAISCVSGYVYYAGFGSPDLAGRYLIPGAPPTSYTVEIERVFSGYTGGSSVGPLDPPVGFPGISGPEFYNGPRESAYDTPTEKTNIPVAVGVQTSNINVILNTQTQPAHAARWATYR